MAVEFTCMDCDAVVFDVVGSEAPEPPRCFVCRWIADQPAEMRDELRARLITEE